MTDERLPVVVGFDGAEHMRECVMWAADEAGRQGRRLVVVSAEDYAGLGLRGPAAMAHLWADEARRRAQATADAGAAIARSRPGTAVEALGALGAPARALTDASVEAALVVVGTRGRSGITEFALGSVAETVASRCACPVVVVRPGAAGHPGPDRPVVVGVDGSARALSAVDVAADVAAACGASLNIVTAWTPTLWSPSPHTVPHLGTPAAWAAGSALGDAVARVHARHPGLDVETVDVEGAPAAVLLRRSADAGLLVVGSEGGGARRKVFLGSVSRAVARNAPCPVAVVGPRCVVPRPRSGADDDASVRPRG